jgi:hypothetical protein
MQATLLGLSATAHDLGTRSVLHAAPCQQTDGLLTFTCRRTHTGIRPRLEADGCAVAQRVVGGDGAAERGGAELARHDVVLRDDIARRELELLQCERDSVFCFPPADGRSGLRCQGQPGVQTGI